MRNESMLLPKQFAHQVTARFLASVEPTLFCRNRADPPTTDDVRHSLKVQARAERRLVRGRHKDLGHPPNIHHQGALQEHRAMA